MSLRFENVTKEFGQRRVLDSVSFSVNPGEILFIIGKSGMGKSVLLKQMIGILKPTSGAIWIDHTDVTLLSEWEWVEVRRKCGMVFQHPALLDSLNIFENISFGLKTPGYLQVRGQPWSDDELRNRVVANLKQVHLDESILDRYPAELSYGTQKRVSLARTLAPGPQYLLFDEPTTGLDPIATGAIHSLIYDLSRQLKVTSIVVSHDMVHALETADRILVLDQGRVLLEGSVEEIRASKEPLLLEFLEDVPSRSDHSASQTQLRPAWGACK